MERGQSTAGTKRRDNGVPSDILTKKQAAEMIGISVRQLDRLPIPKSYAAGPRSPRYLRHDIIHFIQSAMVEPVPGHSKFSNVRPILSRRKGIVRDDWLRSRLAAIQ